MPRHISQLKSLQTLATFVVGKDDGAKIEELGGAYKLSIEKFQNISNAKDASEAKLVDKKNLEELRFLWNGDAEESKHDRDVLDELSPYKNLKKLRIIGYGSTRFSNWLCEHMFCNMVSTKLERCKYCNYLPPLGQLHLLQYLDIRKLDGVVSVGAGFYGIDGSNSVRWPFASLESLSFS